MTEIQYRNFVKKLLWLILPALLINGIALYGAYRGFSEKVAEQIESQDRKNIEQDKKLLIIESKTDTKADKAEIQSSLDKIETGVIKLNEKLDKHIDYHLATDKQITARK